MINGRRSGRAWAALIAAIIACTICVQACAISPEQYRSALEENVEAYSDTKDWRRVATQLCADETGVRDGDGEFAITDQCGSDSLSTGAAKLNITGRVQNGNVVSISVKLMPVNGLTREYEYQAFSISEIAFESLLNSRAAYSDMSAYLFLYDIYPYAMWARDSEFGDNTRALNTALGGVKYSIMTTSSGSDNSINMSIEIYGDAEEEDEAAARMNLNANYALESICSLVYELDVCKGTCLNILKSGNAAGSLSSLMDDMRSCAQEYFALGAGDYDKLTVLTDNLDTEFDNMLNALNSLESSVTDDAMDALDSSVANMCKALKVMY